MTTYEIADLRRATIAAVMRKREKHGRDAPVSDIVKIVKTYTSDGTGRIGSVPADKYEQCIADLHRYENPDVV